MSNPDGSSPPPLPPARTPLRDYLYNALRIALLAAVLVALTAALIAVLLMVSNAARRSQKMRQNPASCQMSLKQLGLMLKMYANEAPGERYPPPVAADGAWTVDLRAVFPEYLSDPTVFVCPQHEDFDDLWATLEPLRWRQDAPDPALPTPQDFDAAHHAAVQSYVYMGWATNDLEDFERVQRALREGRLAPGQDVELGAVVQDNVYALREGVERFLITDMASGPAASAQLPSMLPILFDRFGEDEFRHDGGCNVLFLDGHIEFIRGGEAYPILPAVARAFAPPGR